MPQADPARALRPHRLLPAVLAGSLVLFGAPAEASAQSANFSFFVTSVGKGAGADLGGVTGADEHCDFLAYRAGAGDLTWRAYLSATGVNGGERVDARDRIGTGPWYNFRGVRIAADLAELHDGAPGLTAETALTERGQRVPGRGSEVNWHDILTGSTPEGTAFAPGEDSTCSDWTSSGEGRAYVGHHDREGIGEAAASWNSAHASRGCGQENLLSTGGNGLFYCFAVTGGA